VAVFNTELLTASSTQRHIPEDNILHIPKKFTKMINALTTECEKRGMNIMPGCVKGGSMMKTRNIVLHVFVVETNHHAY
jgi:hypothetical protein